MALEREFLQSLSSDERADLLQLGTVRNVEPEDVLIERGEVADVVLVVITGRVQIVRGEDVVAERGPGALLGEMALADKRPRSATVRASEPSAVLVVPANNFRAFIARAPQAALAVIEQLGRRLREAERR